MSIVHRELLPTKFFNKLPLCGYTWVTCRHISFVGKGTPPPKEKAKKKTKKKDLLQFMVPGFPGLPKPSFVKVLGAPRAQWFHWSPNEWFHIDN